MSETGPVYGVELIDTLPMNYGQTKGMLQAMPSAADLNPLVKRFARVAAGYEVLLNHWREQAEEIERLRSALAPFLAAAVLACGNIEDESWNPEYHLEITVTIGEARAAAEAAREKP